MFIKKFLKNCFDFYYIRCDSDKINIRYDEKYDFDIHLFDEDEFFVYKTSK